MVIPQTEITISVMGREVHRVTVPPGEYVLGRQEDCDIVVEDDEVSRRHARLHINYDSALIEDMGSSLGTYVNEKAVAEKSRLWPNQTIRLGPKVTVLLHRIKGDTSIGNSLPPVQATVQRLLPDEFFREKKYDINGVIAQGGMGVILQATEATTERTVAMKVMIDTMTPADLVRFIDEARVTAQLEHPNIVPVHDLAVDENEKVFYTMKYVRGVTLRLVLEQLQAGDAEAARKFPRAELLTIFQKVCDAVAFAHSKGVIHRDLKPENVMLGDFGEVLLMDWGLMKVVGKPDERRTEHQSIVMRSMVRKVDDSISISTTMAGSVFGTAQYMSPEQAAGQGESVDARADVYSLGAILYQILCWRPSVVEDDPMDIVDRVKDGKIDSISNPRERVPDSLAAVVRKAMALRPGDRYRNVTALQKDITAYQAGFATTAERAGFFKQVALLVQRNKAVVGTAFAAWAVVTALGICFVLNLQSEQRKTKAALNTAQTERNVAKTALSNLRKTAPTFYETAKVADNEAKYDEALEKIGYAISLDEKNPDYHLFRANLLESQQQIVNARADYQRVLDLRPDDPAAQTNLTLCDKLLQESGGQPLGALQLRKLVDSLKQQRRIADAAPLDDLLNQGTSKNSMAETILAHVKEILATKGRGNNLMGIGHLQDGNYSLDLSSSKIDDLSVLKGLPIEQLSLTSSNVTDLTALSGVPTLRTLNLYNAKVKDLAPLHGLPLRDLNLQGTLVEDLSPLRGMPLEILNVGYTPVTDLTPLSGLLLKELRINNTGVSDLGPLRGMKLSGFHGEGTSVTDLSPLQGMPLTSLGVPQGVKNLSNLRLDSLDSINIADHSKIASFDFLANSPVQSVLAYLCPNLDDISALATCTHLRQLSLGRSAVSDLSPLSKLPLTFLDVSDNPVTSLEPLRGLPLKTLNLNGTQITDLSPLADCATLENVILPNSDIDLSVLRTLPNLKTLSTKLVGGSSIYKFDAKGDETTAGFWKDYEAKHTAHANPPAKN